MHCYTLIVNAPAPKGAGQVAYSFGHTRGILLRIGKGRGEVSATMRVKKTPDDILDGNGLFEDALKRLKLFHCLTYGSALKIERIYFAVDEEKPIQVGDDVAARHLPVALFDEERAPRLGKAQARRVMEAYLDKDGEKGFKHLRIAMDAWLMARSAGGENERLLCGWAAISGLYKYVDMLVCRAVEAHGEDTGRGTECMRIQQLHSVLNGLIPHGGCTWNAQARISMANAAKGLLGNSDLETADRALLSGDGELPKSLGELMRKREAPDFFTPWSFLALELGYVLRCDAIHANKPMITYEAARNYELRQLRMVNRLIEELLFETLPLWLGSEETRSEVESRAKKLWKARVRYAKNGKDDGDE